MRIVASKKQQIGITPSIGLVNPKHADNLGMVVRAANCFGVRQVWYSGNRVKLEDERRIPRELRMKEYDDVELIQYDYFFDQFPKGVVPVAIELKEGAEDLTGFIHPENAFYIFGPEDGSVPSNILKFCHRIVQIPTKTCTNLAAAVYITLYDRMAKAANGY
jgi:tRNA(Leu) C34 or U34 (ribose-2'-O)-methylase TrmL